MRKWKMEYWLLALTVAFALFTGGYFLGRGGPSATDSSVRVSTQFQPPAAQEAPKDADTAEPAPPDPEPADAPAGLVDLNSATQEELMTLPGIGEGLAGRIIEYRAAFGGFSDVQELTQVSGIGEGKLKAIEELVTVR